MNSPFHFGKASYAESISRAGPQIQTRLSLNSWKAEKKLNLKNKINNITLICFPTVILQYSLFADTIIDNIIISQTTLFSTVTP